MASHVSALATTTGTEQVSSSKAQRNYRYVKDKWDYAKLSPQDSDLVRPRRVKECPVQMECEFVFAHPMMQTNATLQGLIVAIEVRIVRVHVNEELRMEGHANRIDPDRWRPMIMSFQEFYGLRDGKLAKSILGNIGEEEYRRLTGTGPLHGDEISQYAEKVRGVWY